MFLFEKNLGAEALVHRLVRMSVENPQKLETEKIDAPERIEGFDLKKIEKELHPENKKVIPGRPEDEPRHLTELKAAEKALEKGYESPTGLEKSREIPAELQKMSRAQIRNLERKNPELLLKTCFWKIDESEKITPIESSGELKIGDKIKFSIAEATGKNKNLEMGAGLRTLPRSINVVEIGGEKFFRVSDGGPFVDKNGEYRAVRSHENETITLLAESPEDKEIIAKMATRKKEFVRNDVGFALDDFLAKKNLTLTPESVDQFLAEMENDSTATPEMRAAAREQAESIKKFAELWADFNIGTYKQDIAAIESGGQNYNADNHGRGASDSWNKRAIGKYQFTIETLNSMGVPIRSEADIAEFKQNGELQEKIMNDFTSEHISRVRDNPNVVAQIGKGVYSIDQVLGAMHLGGDGALRKVERGQTSEADYMGTTFANYMSRLKQPNKTA